MNKTIEIRDAVRNYVIDNSTWLRIVGKGIVALLCFLIINHYFGYISLLANPIIAIVIAIGCAFIPMKAVGLLIVVYIFAQLTGLSGQVAIVALLLMLGSYGLSIFYGAKNNACIEYIPVALQVQMPYPIVVLGALFGRLSDIVPVVCGGILSYYLKVIRENASLFIEKTEDISVIDLISRKMIVNPIFYVYILALITLFLIVVIVKDTRIKHSWLAALSIGIFVEMFIMMLGYILTGSISKVPMLIVANVVAFLVGTIATYIFRDLDYERIERVQFEDDDYIYYVTAIPKIGLAREEKRVTRITDVGSKFHKLGKVESEEGSSKED